MKVLADILPTLSLAPRWKTKGYTAISNSLVLNKNISAGACRLQLYLLIRCFNKDFSYPGHQTIMKDLGIKSEHTLINYKKELLSAGLIKQKRRRNKTSIYFLKF